MINWEEAIWKAVHARREREDAQTRADLQVAVDLIKKLGRLPNRAYTESSDHEVPVLCFDVGHPDHLSAVIVHLHAATITGHITIHVHWHGGARDEWKTARSIDDAVTLLNGAIADSEARSYLLRANALARGKDDTDRT